jgi:hypothetical protein
MGDSPNISDHGRIGDLQTAALIETDATIDPFHCPRFDLPSGYASPLIDTDRGGYSRVTLKEES